MATSFEYLRDPAAVEKIVPHLLQQRAMGWDTETTGLDPHTDKVILASIAAGDKTYVIDTREPRCLQALRPALESETVAKIGAHLGFDYGMVKGTAGFDTENNWDIMLGEQILTAGLQKRGFSLQAVSKKYLNVERDKSLQKSFIGHKGEFTPEQLQYSADDVRDLIPLAKIMRDKMQPLGLLPTWKVENDCLPAFADMSFHGQKIDVPAWKELIVESEANVIKAKLELDRFFEPYCDRDLFGVLDINYASHPQVLWGFQMMGIQVDGETIQNSNKETQKKISHLPVIQALERLRGAEKRISTYGQNFLDAIHPKTGRIHPKFFQIGTGSGRCAATEGLNVLNIPRDKRYREAFIADSFDDLISTVDYSAAELRIMAELSGDPLTVRGFNSGIDFHCYVAAMLFGRDKVEKSDPIRQPTKTLNFGLAYGMGPHRLFNQLKGEGVEITFEACEDLFKRYKETFKTTIAWLEAQKRIAVSQLYMQNYNGRIRWWRAPDEHRIRAELSAAAEKKNKGKPFTSSQMRELNEEIRYAVKGQWAGIEREAANHMVQSGNVEWTKPAMAQIRKECKRRQWNVRMYNSVYDEIVLHTPKSIGHEVHEMQKRIMIECGQRFLKRVPVTVEGHLEHHWKK